MSYTREMQGATYTYQSLLVAILFDVKNAKHTALLGDVKSYMERLHSLWVFSPPEVKQAMERRGMGWTVFREEVERQVADASATRNPFIKQRRVGGTVKRLLDSWLEAMMEELILCGLLVRQRVLARGEEGG